MSETIIRWATDTRNYYSWNCNKVSPGCMNCYAKSLAERKGQQFDGAPQWRDNVRKEKIKPGHIYFVNSMSDTYHEGVPVQWIHRIHNEALAHPEATFLVLTKRIERAYYLAPYLAWPPNLWLGTSIENEGYLWRLDYLLDIPAAGHFVSAEPLLGRLPGLFSFMKPWQWSVRRGRWRARRHLGWVIVGAESGGNRRPFDKAWAREIRDMCLRYQVPFMFKQGSAFKSEQDRLLDGREWNESPFTLPGKDEAVTVPEPVEIQRTLW